MFCHNCGNKISKNDKFCDNCGIKAGDIVIPANTQQAQIYIPETAPDVKHTRNLWILAGVIVLVIIGAVVFTTYENKQQAVQSDLATQQQKTDLLSNQLEDVKRQNSELHKQNSPPLGNPQSVVNVFCDNGNGGSGTIFTEDGWVLTNNHVIKNAISCNITLPDSVSGSPVSIYKASPNSVPNLSNQYDIAMLNIDGSYTDSDGKTWGDYPTTFPAFSPPDSCASSTPKLGDSIKIYGYPITSGGYNLTITDGIISSFADDEKILTSAKIDSGNSGGLAVDENGCFVGIPTAVVKGTYQNLGVIIPKTIINDFIDQVKSQQ